MIKTITGCLIKYNKPFPNGAMISPSAFFGCKKDRIPVFPNFLNHVDVIGYCDLDYREDGVYYIFHPVDTDIAHQTMELVNDDSYIGAYLNKVLCADATSGSYKDVRSANIVCGAFSSGHYESAYVDKITFELEDKSNDN